MNTKVKTALKVVAALLVILMPLALIFGIAVLTVPQYSNTFVGVLRDAGVFKDSATGRVFFERFISYVNA